MTTRISTITLIFLLIVSSSRGDTIRSAIVVDVPPSSSSSSSSSTSSSLTSSIPVVGLALTQDDHDHGEDEDDVHTTSPIVAVPSSVTSSPTNAATSPPPPAPSVAPRPTIPPTPSPSKKYVSPDDGNDDDIAHEIEREVPKITRVLLWVLATFGVIWTTCYFRDAISFFVGNVYTSARRHGCRGCTRSLFPWRFGGGGGGGGGRGETLDQIIFESDDDNAAPLLP